jgi:hypothetical protein
MSVRLGTGACMGMGIGIWNDVDIKLFDGLRECEMAGSDNGSLDDGGREPVEKGGGGGSKSSSLGLEIMSSSALR